MFHLDIDFRVFPFVYPVELTELNMNSQDCQIEIE